MKEPTIFNPIAGSSILSISWFPDPLGDAVEAKNGAGVGFFGHNGDLLSVQFDDVEESQDHQFLEFNRHRVEVTVNKGKISYSMTELPSSKRASRRPKKRSKSAA